MMDSTSIRRGSRSRATTRATGANVRRGRRLHRVAAIRHVLVPLAGSPNDERAVAMALDLARLHRARVSLVHVIGPSCDRVRSVLEIARSSRRGAEPANLPRRHASEADRATRAARAMLARAATRFADAQVWVDCAVVAGPRACSIVRTAERIGADLIVMSHRGATNGRPLGSTSEAVARTARCAVVLVKQPRARTARDPDAPFARRSGDAEGCSQR